MKHLLPLFLVLSLCSCKVFPPYVYTEMTVAETDMDLLRGIGEDSKTIEFTLGFGWYTSPIPVRVVRNDSEWD